MNKTYLFQRLSYWLLKLVCIFLILYFIFLAIYFIFFATQGSAGNLLAVWSVYFPIGVFTYVLYGFVKNRFSNSKVKELSETISRATDYIRRVPLKLGEFDVALSNEIRFSWEGVRVPFALAISRMLTQAKFGFMSEFHRGRNIDVIRTKLDLLSLGVKEQDYSVAYESLGALFAFPLGNATLSKNEKKIDYHTKYIQVCQQIANLLESGKLIDADQDSKKLSQLLPKLKSVNSPLLSWQALISYWIYIRISFLLDPQGNSSNSLYLGPSKTLAREIGLMVDLYMNNNWKGIGELINESFHRSKRTPGSIFR